MKNVVLDLETNDLEEVATCIHSLVIRDLDTDEVLASCTDSCGKEFHPIVGGGRYATLAEGVEILKTADRIYGHNLIRFDRPVLKRLREAEIPWEKVRDTLVISNFRFAHLKELDFEAIRKGKLKLPQGVHAGSHSLEAWGVRLGIHKGSFSKQDADWSTWTPEMQTYCEQDTKVTAALVRYFQRVGGIPAQAIEIEQELAEYLWLQEKNGWPIDLEKAGALQGKLAGRRGQLEDELRQQFKPWAVPVKAHREVVIFIPKARRSVTIFDDKEANKAFIAEHGRRLTTPDAQYTKVVWTEFNPGSRFHIADRLQKLYGWKPTVFTPNGQPEVNEETLTGLPDIPGVNLLKEYLLVTKRLGQLAEGKEAWLTHATKERPFGGKLTGMAHVHGGVKQNGAVTHRAAHVHPNLGQVPAVTAPFGEECRGLFGVPRGWVQIGADASGLELRKLSHYMAKYDDGAYGKAVVYGKNDDGTDIHSINRDALGLVGKAGRNEAKRFIYAFLYGAGPHKLGTIVPPSTEEVDAYRSGKRWAACIEKRKKNGEALDDFNISCHLKGEDLKAKFLKNLPALDRLISAVKGKAKESGYLLLQDGRRVYVRHQHAALNSLLQGSGAIDCKAWIVRFNRRFTQEFGPQGWTGKWAALGWIHDEVQIAVRPEIEKRAKEILVEEIRATGEMFASRVPLDGEAKSGRNWADTH